MSKEKETTNFICECGQEYVYTLRGLKMLATKGVKSLRCKHCGKVFAFLSNDQGDPNGKTSNL
jgi:predicted SprT family Zn-dependent metalloprotease